MCGLTGVIGDISYKHKQAFETLLILDVVRGPHSTGVARIKKDTDWTVAKALGTPHNLFDTKSYDKTAVVHDTHAFMGHNRYATKGKINAINAHPFEFKHVVGCHNGTLSDTSNLPDHRDFEVDSENLMHAIDQDGIEEYIEDIRGAFAISVYDSRENTYYLARNKERPLFYVYTKDNKTMFYASEYWMLDVALSRHNIEHQDIIMMPEGNLFKFKLSRSNGMQLTIRAFTPWTKPLPAPQKTQSTHNKGGNVTPITATKDSRFPKRNLPQGTSIEFEVVKETSQYGGQRYIEGRIMDDEWDGVEVRVFAPQNGTLWHNLINSPNTFTGKVQSCCFYNNVNYVVMRLDGIEEYEDVFDLEDIPTDPKEKFGGYRGSVLSKKDWDHRTRYGCAWCTDNADPVTSDFMLWLSEDSFLCADCATKKDVASSMN